MQTKSLFLSYKFILPILLLVAVVMYFWLSKESSTSTNTPYSNSPTVSDDAQRTVIERNTSQQFNDNSTATVDGIPVIAGNERTLVGRQIRVRELLNASSDDGESVRNLEFVFRPGINPKKLFDHNNFVILNYDQFYLNQVGTGAVAAFMYYELVTADTNGDGKLDGADKHSVAVSYPDGSDFATLVTGLDEVSAYEHISAGNELHLSVKLGDQLVEQFYSLVDKSLLRQVVSD